MWEVISKRSKGLVEFEVVNKGRRLFVHRFTQVAPIKPYSSFFQNNAKAVADFVNQMCLKPGESISRLSLNIRLGKKITTDPDTLADSLVY